MTWRRLLAWYTCVVLLGAAGTYLAYNRPLTSIAWTHWSASRYPWAVDSLRMVVAGTLSVFIIWSLGVLDSQNRRLLLQLLRGWLQRRPVSHAWQRRGAHVRLVAEGLRRRAGSEGMVGHRRLPGDLSRHLRSPTFRMRFTRPPSGSALRSPPSSASSPASERTSSSALIASPLVDRPTTTSSMIAAHDPLRIDRQRGWILGYEIPFSVSCVDCCSLRILFPRTR
jgi:hypothetical protein